MMSASDYKPGMVVTWREPVTGLHKRLPGGEVVYISSFPHGVVTRICEDQYVYIQAGDFEWLMFANEIQPDPFLTACYEAAEAEK